MQIGFVGVGLMGGPLCRNLIRAGKEVLVFDLSKEAIERTLAVEAPARRLNLSRTCLLVMWFLPHCLFRVTSPV